MSGFDGDNVTREELAWELVEVFDDLHMEQINELLVKNVPLETLRFFATYADEVADAESVTDDTRRRLPNLLLLGYLLRLLEERLIHDPEPQDA